MPSRRLLAIGHDHVAGLGHLDRALVRRGFDVTLEHVVPQDRFERPDVDPDLPDLCEWDAVVTLGAPWPRERIGTWWPTEVSALRRAHEAGVPVLGVCFGAQLLAEALGGSTVALAAPRVGWCEVHPSNGAVDRGPWFQWHSDQVVEPPRSTVLATSSDGCEAFALQQSLGVQFHPEMDPELLDRWLGLPGPGGDESRARELREVTASLTPAALRERADRLVGLWLDGGGA